jgi:hypothetical protein
MFFFFFLVLPEMLIAGMEFPMLNRQLATSGSDTQGVRIIKLFFSSSLTMMPNKLEHLPLANNSSMA